MEAEDHPAAGLVFLDGVADGAVPAARADRERPVQLEGQRRPAAGRPQPVLAEGGVAGVAVDRLAKKLAVTRGSFYWHFSDRTELIDAALAEWERANTTALIPEVEAIGDPVERLRVLFSEVYEQEVDAVEISLAASADEPLVAPVFARVTEQRLDFLRRVFTDLGLPEAEADNRAWLAYTLCIGHHQLGRNRQTKALQPKRLDRLVDLLTSPVRPPTAPRSRA